MYLNDKRPLTPERAAIDLSEESINHFHDKTKYIHNTQSVSNSFLFSFLLSMKIITILEFKTTSLLILQFVHPWVH